MPLVFVYGTLRTPAGGTAADTRYHGRIADAIVARRRARLPNALLYDLGAYPGVGPGAGTVIGEVFEIDDAALLAADVIEGHPEFYARRVEQVVIDPDRLDPDRPDHPDHPDTADSAVGPVEAWVYWAPPSLLSGRPTIDSGDWFDRQPANGVAPPLMVPDEPELRAALDRFGREEYSWFTSVGADARPHSVPMWHVVSGNRIYFATAPDAVKRANIARNPNVALTLVDPVDVVRITGWAIEASGAQDMVSASLHTKYGWNLVADDPTHVVIEVTPRAVSTWSGYGTRHKWQL